MKITPLDIAQQEFKLSFRGYHREDVQGFLASVSQAFEALAKENVTLKERVETLEGQRAGLLQKEAALNNLLMTTQTMAESLKQQAHREADLILKEAELNAEDVVKRAQGQYGHIQRDIQVLQRQRLVILEKLRALLQTFHKMIELEELDQDTLDPSKS